MMLQTARNRATRRAAFTLLEILVVVAIVVILAGVGVVATTSYLENAKKSKAVLGCKGISQAAEAYYLNPSSNNTYPQSLQDMVQPPFGGPLLKNGQQDTIDPWGRPYNYELRTLSDGSQVPFVHTKSPDNIDISQYGVGPAAQPPQQ
jgi:general secretion pathway protein G